MEAVVPQSVLLQRFHLLVGDLDALG